VGGFHGRLPHLHYFVCITHHLEYLYEKLQGFIEIQSNRNGYLSGNMPLGKVESKYFFQFGGHFLAYGILLPIKFEKVLLITNTDSSKSVQSIHIFAVKSVVKYHASNLLITSATVGRSCAFGVGLVVSLFPLQFISGFLYCSPCSNVKIHNYTILQSFTALQVSSYLAIITCVDILCLFFNLKTRFLSFLPHSPKYS
jgi:hypothetical protein